MALQSFGGIHTEIKLDVLENYLDAYTKALKNQKFQTVFFDAFAGTGSIEVPSRTESSEGLLPFIDVTTSDKILEGSARRALKLETPFHQYIFVEKLRRKSNELSRLKADFPALANRIFVRTADANDELERFCKDIKKQNCRAVVFLDPFGNQIIWDTLQLIAETNKIDLWYLFPAGLGVNRQIREAGFHEPHAESLGRLLGTKDWRTFFYETKIENDLFGSTERSEKAVNAKGITFFMQNRMKEIFKGIVLEDWLQLGSRGVHMYSLMFATANPSAPAINLAKRLASDVIKSRGAAINRRTSK